MDQPTTFTDIETSFHSMPLTKYRIDPGLEKQWLETALADYELELNVALDYDSESESFSNKLDRPTIRILALMIIRLLILQAKHFQTHLNLCLLIWSNTINIRRNLQK